jgi:hypothetical protein
VDYAGFPTVCRTAVWEVLDGFALSGRLVTIVNDQRGPRVDTALKLNVVMVCAVFLFVGAIILGAF